MKQKFIAPDKNERFHGSDLEKVEKAYGIPKESIVGFGANVNPLGVSEDLKTYLAGQLDCLRSYPDREYEDLRRAIASYVETDMDTILVGNGATELISLCIGVLRPAVALALGPSYSEYGREVSLAGGKLEYLYLDPERDFAFSLLDLKAALTEDVSLFILCNPNNPTSTALDTNELKGLLTLCRAKGVTVLIDETYAEFAPDIGRITAIPLTKSFDNLIVLRGTSKFFACPGLRLGYAVTGNQSLREEILSKKDPWSVSSLAERAGLFLFSDSSYIRKTRELMDGERKKILTRLSAIHCLKVYRPTANFVLARILDPAVSARDVFEACIRRGMMIRDCADFPGLDDSYFRFCFMNSEENDRLLTCLEETLGTREAGHRPDR